MALNFSIKIQSEIDESKNFRVEQAEIKYISAEDGLMLKDVYDTNENGIVDNAEKLGGKEPAYYATATTVSNLSARVTTLETDVANALAAI